MDTFLKEVATLDSCGTETQQPCVPAASACFAAKCTTSFALVDPTLPDAPAVYANEAFEQLTGYSAAETIGRNLRFLQGSDQHQPGLGDLRRAIQDKRPCHTFLRNYKKDGTFFWNDLRLTPILDSQGEVSLWIGVQSPVTQQKLIDMGMYAPVASVSPGSGVPSASLGRLGEILVAQGVVTRADAMAAVQLQLDGNKQPLGEILVERFGVPEYAITQALSVQIDDARAKNCQTDLLLKTAFAVRLAQTTMEAVPEKDLPLFSLCQPMSDAGGDTFYPVRLADGSQLLLLADVAGHSVISSYAVAAFLGMCCALSGQLVSGQPQGLRALFVKLNDCLLQGPFADVPICVLAAHWNMAQGRLHIINAGMPHGFWFQRDDGPTRAIEVDGNPLGILNFPHMEERVIALRPGERAIFGSDGLFETLSPEGVMFQDVAAFHLDTLSGKPLGNMVGTFCALSRAHGHEQISDDLLAVAIEQPPIAALPFGFRMHLPSTFAAIDGACDRLVAFLHSQPALTSMAEDTRFALLLAAREALSNAVIHGNREEPTRNICFACSTEPPFQRLTMTVTDEGIGFNLGQYSAPPDLQTSERGRGVPILQATAVSMRMIGGELQLEFELDAQPEEASR